MQEIFKYVLPREQIKSTLSMPIGAQILAIQNQREQLCIWAKVDPSKESEERKFEICGTGNKCSDGKYIGTVQVFGGDLVWHVFELKKEK